MLNMNTQKLYEAVQERAFNARLTMGQVCEAAGMTRASASHWNKGNTPHLSTIGKLEKALQDMGA